MNPDFSGVWKADLQKSKLLGAQPKAVLAKIKHCGEKRAAAMLITKADGGEDQLLFRGRTSGGEVTREFPCQLYSCL